MVMELLIMTDALRRASASRITAVLPYYGYARQDRKSRGREPITAKLVANMITEAGASRLLAMDLHAMQIQGFFDMPVDNLFGLPILAEYFKHKDKDVYGIQFHPEVHHTPKGSIIFENFYKICQKV